MVVIMKDDKIRNVKLTGDEIDEIIDELGRVSHNVYAFMSYDKLIKKLKEAKNEKRKK